MRQRWRRRSNVGTGAPLLQRRRSGGCCGVDGAAASTSAASTQWSSWPARLRTVKDTDAAALAARMRQRRRQGGCNDSVGALLLKCRRSWTGWGCRPSPDHMDLAEGGGAAGDDCRRTTRQRGATWRRRGCRDRPPRRTGWRRPSTGTRRWGRMAGASARRGRRGGGGRQRDPVPPPPGGAGRGARPPWS
jgi:hypothetical protein